MRVKFIKSKYSDMLQDFPNFHRTGSIKGMKRLYYGKDALLVRCGSWIYNVSFQPDIYYEKAK